MGFRVWGLGLRVPPKPPGLRAVRDLARLRGRSVHGGGADGVELAQQGVPGLRALLGLGFRV